MLDSYKWRSYFFQTKQIDVPEKLILLRDIDKDSLSEKAQEKLGWIIFYHTIEKLRYL